MRQKKIFFSFAFVFLIIVVVTASVSLLVVKSKSLLTLENYIGSVINGKSDIRVSMDGIDRHFLSYIEVDGLKLQYRDTDILRIDSLHVSSGIPSLIKAVRGQLQDRIRIRIIGADLMINQEFSDFLRSYEKKDSDFISILSKFSIDLRFVDFSFKVEVDENRLESSDKINLNVQIQKNITLSGLSGLIPSVSGYYAPSDSEFEVSRLVLSSNNKHELLVNIATASLGKTFKLENLKSKSTLQNAQLDGKCSVDEFSMNYSEYSIFSENLEFDFGLNIYSPKDSLTLSSDIGNVLLQSELTSLWVEDIGGSVAFLPENRGLELFFSAGKAELDELESIRFNDVVLNDCFTSIRLRQDLSGSIEFNSFVKADSRIEALKHSSGNLSFSGEFDSIKNYRDYHNYNNTVISVENLSLNAFEGKNSVNVSFMNKDSVEIEINTDCGISGTVKYNIDSQDTSSKFYFLNFKPYVPVSSIEVISDRYMKYLNRDSVLNGSFVLDGILNPENITGRLSVNVAMSDVNIRNSSTILATTIEATAENNIVDVESFALTMAGLRLSYSGSFDLEKFFPQGNLVLQRAANGKEIGKLTFMLDDDMMGYQVRGTLAEKDYAELNAHVSWNDLSNIKGFAFFTTRYGRYDLSFLYNIKDRHLIFESDQSKAELWYVNNEFRIDFSLRNFAFHFSNNIILKANADISGSYKLSGREFLLSCDNFEIIVSDILSCGFDMFITQDRFFLNNLSVSARGKKVKYTGQADIRYSSLAVLFAGNTDNLRADVDFRKIDSDDYFLLFVSSNSYSLNIESKFVKPFSISLLGSRGNGFFADCSVDEIFFEARYKDKKLVLNTGHGNIGSLDLKSFDFNFDFVKRNLSGKMQIERLLHNYTGDVKQGCSFEISAQLDSVFLSALSFAGFDVGASFSISLKDAFLGDEFYPVDTEISISVNKSGCVFNSDTINGRYMFDSKYLDIAVDKSFLFGFHARGYAENNLDLYVDEIYLPLKISNQFLNMPILETKKGILEGDLLIIGPSYDPSFYGSLYVQTLELTLVYLPNQTLGARDVVFTAHDHDISLEKTTVVGSSSEDGRFYTAFMEIDLELGKLNLSDFRLNLDIGYEPIDFWFPLKSKKLPVNIRGDVTGQLAFWGRNGESGLDGDIKIENADISFNTDNIPEWMKLFSLYCSANVTLTMGKDVEFFYPDKDKSFINFKISENQKMKFSYNMITKDVWGEGNLDIESGRISYINNDFTISEGELKVGKPLFSSDFMFAVSLIAKLREYDANGKRVDISLILKNATLDNFKPRFDSMPKYNENEIINILGQSVIPGKDENISLSSIANAAAIATNAMSSLGIINTNKDYLVSHVIRDSLNLDVLSFRSHVIQNIIINSMPGTDTADTLLAKYLNGTALFAGKYLNDHLFAKMSFVLRNAKGKKRLYNYGHFLTEDLNLDMELSVDWDNPLGNFSVFMQPQELSVLNFLDTIGFSVTKRLQF